jgi:hypothetical protein
MKNAKPPARSPQKKQPFIVREIDARMLRKHPTLSKGARMLWLTMLSMANAKTGELRHREHWYCGKEIDRRAEISDRTRQQQMKELIMVGLVRMEQERREGVLTDSLTGHKRWRKGVFGETHYFVFKSPHKDWFSYTEDQKSPHKQRVSTARKYSQPLESRNTPNKTEGQYQKSPHKQRVSTARKFYRAGRISATSTSVLHQETGVGVSGSVAGGSSLDGSTVGRASASAVDSDIANPLEENGGYAAESSSSSLSGKAPAEKNDDDSAAGAATLSPEAPDRIELLLEKAKAILVGKGHDHDFVEIALARVEQRAVDWGKAPATVQYYLTGFENALQSPEESQLVRDLVEERKARYEKFGIPRDLTQLRLTPEQQEARRRFNELHNGTPVQPKSENSFSDVQQEPAPKIEPIPNTPWPVSSGTLTITRDEAAQLLFNAKHHRGEAVERTWNAVQRKLARFENHTGEFQSEEKRREFSGLLYRLHNKKQANAGRNQRRRELRKQRHATHDDLLKDTNNYGKLQWGGRYIVVRTGGDRREIISHNAAQALTGCSTEHMAEHLRANGFWAEVYQPATKHRTRDGQAKKQTENKHSFQGKAKTQR